MVGTAAQRASQPGEVRTRTVTRAGRAKNYRLTSDAKRMHQQRLKKIVSSDVLTESERRSMVYDIGQRVLARSRTMKNQNFTLTTATDLTYMAELYDRFFYGGHCLALARNCGMKFRWSKRMTSTGGKTVRIATTDKLGQEILRYEIVLSATLLFQTFADLRRPIRVTGLLCTNRLQAMQRILEHELIHLVEMLVWDESCCAAPRFQAIAGRLFGHTEHKHDLITQQERAASKFNVRVGSRVRFVVEGRLREGVVNRITRRATVLVRDEKGQLYDDGCRYAKFYVPISHLHPATGKRSQ
ncbi:MAG: hypothetical protein AB8B50_11935 [Pirellulaceae bacterium]